MHTHSANIQYKQGIEPQIPASTTEVVGDYADMKLYNNFAMGCMLSHAVGVLGSATFYIAQSTDNTTWSNNFMATATLSSSTTTCSCTSIEVRAEQMANGYRYLRGEVVMAATCNTSCISAGYMRFNARYVSATLATR